MIPFHVILGIAVGCALITAAATPMVRRLAVRFGLVDDPAAGVYKTHLAPLPYGGGIAIYCGGAGGILGLIGLTFFDDPLAAPRMLTGLVAGLEMAHYGQVLALFVCSSAVFLVGVVDDWIGLPPLPRLTMQIAAAGFLAWGVPGFSLPLAPGVPWVAPLATTLWVVALTNAFNFLDNMDGLVAGMSVIAFASIGMMALWTSHIGAAVLSLSLAGACAGFLLFNFPRASIFMGDAGGLFLGFAAAGLTALVSHQLGRVGSHSSSPWPHHLAPLLVLLVAAYDQVTVVGLRLYRGKRPWVGDTNHISHRLVRLGLSRRSAVVVIHGLVAVSGALALTVLALPPAGAWQLFVAAAAVLALVALLDYASARRRCRR